MSFKWPCGRRVAHGPHPRPPLGSTFNTLGDETPIYFAGRGEVTSEENCPGVSAHPATMIGGADEYEKMFIDTRGKVRAAAKRGKAQMLAQDRHGRPIDFEYWYKYNAKLNPN